METIRRSQWGSHLLYIYAKIHDPTNLITSSLKLINCNYFQKSQFV